jgi:serine/threonine protein kinase
MDAMARVSPYVKGVTILRTLGAGSFGRVVLARYPRGDGPERSVDVALKYASRSGGGTRKKILREAACLRKVAHAHVIKLLDVCASTPGGEEDPRDLPTLVFPPADTDLATFLDRSPGGVLPTALARRTMGQLASALDHVHSRGFIHRDVKPANCMIFLAAEVHGEFLGPALVLADFGMARRVSGNPRRYLGKVAPQNLNVQPMTVKVVTAWYRPPELWAGTMDDHVIDADHDDDVEETTLYGFSLDVWSFGAVVYEALSGETLARRAWNGVAMVQALADVIGACPTQGPEALEYTRNPHWKSWAVAAKPAPSRPLPNSGAEWDLVRDCLRWDPSARVAMASAKQCAWFAERVASPVEAPTPTSQTGTRADASTLSTLSARSGASGTSLSAETSRGHALAWLQRDFSPPATTPRTSKKTCSCTGHCRLYQHRIEGKCACTELVIGTAYCITCKCIVAGCDRPKNKNDYCFHHRRVVEEAEFRVQLAAAAVPLASLLMPCDVVDFLSQSALLQDDLAMLILTAAIKEPLPVGALVEAWRQLPAHYSGSDLRSAVLRAVAAADGAPHGAQLDQLHRQGVGRFFGLITVASHLGIIEKKELIDEPVPRRRRQALPVATAAAKPAGAAQQEYRLGKNLTVYKVLGPSESKCDEFLEATRAEECFLGKTPSDAGASTPCAFDDLVDYGTRRVGAALQRIGNKSGALPFSDKDASGYCIDFLKRKLVIARLFRQNLQESDWSTVSKASLQSMSADAKENLEDVPDAWGASQISSFFTGRADWGLFASVYPCLWGEVADKLSTEDDRARALALVKSKDFLRVVHAFRRTEGIAPHPAVAYRILEDQVKEQTKRAKAPTPRASTPRSRKRARLG